MTPGGMRERHGRSTSHSSMTMVEEPPPQNTSPAPPMPPHEPYHQTHHHHNQHHPQGIMRKSAVENIDDADIAAGLLHNPLLPHQTTAVHHHPQHHHLSSKSDLSSSSVVGFAAEPPSRSASGKSSIMTAPSSMQSLASLNTRLDQHPSDLEFFEDLVSEPVLLLGVDISHLNRQSQFLVCATGVFGFSLLYGYLQELISVELCNRQLGLFLAMMQFSGYTLLAYILRNFVYAKAMRHKKDLSASSSLSSTSSLPLVSPVPFALYLGLSLLRAIDLGMTNLAMQYINYPAKTLMKSSRVVFTMLFGVIIARKVYKTIDYIIVMGMVAGLALFMHADANSSAVFDWAGVAMLTVSLLCDGAISNMSETIMNRYGVGQDEFIFRMYSIALVAITAVAAAKGDLREGLIFMSQPGSYGHEMSLPYEERTWSVPGKVGVMVLFSSMGFFGSSCSAAITKNFGALTMSITSTARKATTLFLSFFLFNNVCTMEHLLGVFLFISALTAKSLRRGKKGKKSRRDRAYDRRPPPALRVPPALSDLETRALHHGSSSEPVISLDRMEEGQHIGNAASVSPPASVISNLNDPALSSMSRRSGSRQRKLSANTAAPVQVL